jgi:threonine dehydrogenase-like Zn-dependent dehydrogenase
MERGKSTMQAAVMDGPFKMRVGAWDTPRPGPGEVKVSVGAVGICAGDMYIYVGKNPYAVYPQICGHEIAGVVVEVGEGAAGVEIGSKVVVEPFIGCGLCYPCRMGKSNCCMKLQIIGVHRPGGYADYVTAPANLVHQVPEGLSLSFASFAEPVAIAVQACRRGGVAAGEDVLILGCGPIGLALVEVARARGARVAATDIAPERLEMAAKIGAEIMPAGDSLLPAIMARTNGEGAAVVIEATGNPRAMEQSVELVAAGGRVVIVGLVSQGVGVTLPGLEFTRKEMTVVGSRASVNCFPEALGLLASGAITYPQAATEFSLWDAPKIFADLAERPGLVHKAVLVREV